MINFADYRSILCLNGDLPAADFFKGALPIIAADGAANTLVKMGIKPDLVIGDLDGIEPHLREQLPTLFHYDQDFCDYEKSLNYLEAQALLPCIVLGVNGGFLDHILNNINIFMRSNSCFYAPPLVGYVLREQQAQEWNLALDTKISLIGIPHAEVTTQGLTWELEKAQLTFPGKNSTFNRTSVPTVKITVHQGQVLVLIYSL